MANLLEPLLEFLRKETKDCVINGIALEYVSTKNFLNAVQNIMPLHTCNLEF